MNFFRKLFGKLFGLGMNNTPAPAPVIPVSYPQPPAVPMEVPPIQFPPKVDNAPLKSIYWSKEDLQKALVGYKYGVYLDGVVINEGFGPYQVFSTLNNGYVVQNGMKPEVVVTPVPEPVSTPVYDTPDAADYARRMAIRDANLAKAQDEFNVTNDVLEAGKFDLRTISLNDKPALDYYYKNYRKLQDKCGPHSRSSQMLAAANPSLSQASNYNGPLKALAGEV